MSGILTWSLLWGVSNYVEQQLNRQIERNQLIENKLLLIETQLTQLNQLKKANQELRQQIKVIEQLHISRNLGTQLLSEVVDIIPIGIYLNELKMEKQQLTLTGQSESNDQLAAMLRRIDASEGLKFINLPAITSQSQQQKVLNDFTMLLHVEPRFFLDFKVRDVKK